MLARAEQLPPLLLDDTPSLPLLQGVQDAVRPRGQEEEGPEHVAQLHVVAHTPQSRVLPLPEAERVRPTTVSPVSSPPPSTRLHLARGAPFGTGPTETPHALKEEPLAS